MSKRAYGSAFRASPPNGARVAANAPQPQVQQHLVSTPTSLRIPGQWPGEEIFSPADEEPLPDAITVFSTLSWVATTAVANLLTLPRRLAQRFLRRRNIAAVPVVREDGSNKKRLVDLGFADQPAALSPSARARTNATRRHARQPATTIEPDFWYPGPEPSSSSGYSPSYESSSMDIQSTQPGPDGTDEDDSLDFSFADVWTSPPLKISPIGSLALKSEDCLHIQSPAGQASPTPASKSFNSPSLHTSSTSPVPRRPIPTLRPCSLRPCGVLPQRKPIRLYNGSLFPPLGANHNSVCVDPSRLLHPYPQDSIRHHAPASSVTKEVPKLFGTFGRPLAPKKMIPRIPDLQADTAKKFRHARQPPSITRTRLGQPLIIDPARPLAPLCPTTLGEKERYYVAPLPRALKSASGPTPVPKGPYTGVLTAALGNPAWRASKSASITPMRRQLLKVQFTTQASQEQLFSGPGIGPLNPTHSEEPTTSSYSPRTDALSSSSKINVPSFTFEAHVEPPTPQSQVPVEDSFVYENDLSFLTDAPSPTPPPRKTVTWNKNLEERKFYCDENVTKMMQSVFQKIFGVDSTKTPNTDNNKEPKDPEQSKETPQEQGQDSFHRSFEYEDDSTDAESGLSTVDDDESNGVSTDALEDEDASHDSLFDEGSNISQLDNINDQSFEESEISMELLEEVRQKVEKSLNLKAPSPPPLKPLVSALNAQEDDELEAVAEKASRSKKPEAHVVCKKLSLRDFGTLLPTMFNGNPRAWLNDNIVNEYLSILVNHKKKEASFDPKSSNHAPPVHAFLSFWYQSPPASIARWAVKVQLGGSQYLEADLILYPICDNGHWRLLAVKPKERVIEYLDSLGYPGKKYVTKFKEYMQTQLGPGWVEDEWTVVELQNSTQQLNGSDCGVFTLLNALVLLRGEEPKRVLADYGMEDARKRIATTLLAGQPTTEWD